jgi:PAS domain S-box-containing protein
MPDSLFSFKKNQINNLFPFFIMINAEMEIISIGPSLKKITEIKNKNSFNTHFLLKSSKFLNPSYSDFKSLLKQLIIIEYKQNNKLVLRGQIDYLEDKNCFLFVGTPWFNSMDDVREFKLTLHDFATHDPMIDLLHVLKTQEISTQEIKELLNTVFDQKDKLRQSEYNYRSIIEKATDIIYKADENGYFTFVNDVATHITGFSKDELFQMKYVELIRDDFKNKAYEFYSDQVKNNIPTTYFEFPILTKSKAEIWIGQSVQINLKGNSQVELVALAIDITKRKLAELNLKLQEEKYRNIIANMNLGLLEVDNDDFIQFANQSFCKISGYTLNELKGQKASDLFMDQKGKEVISIKSKDRKAGVSDVYTVPIINKKGETRWWVISGAPRYDDNGELVGSVGIHLDVTEQKLLEEELNIAKIKAEESSKAKEYFLATMSHEIRTPLNAIIGISDLMKLNTNARNIENIDTLSFSAKNLLALITDILDLSKIDSGKIELSKNTIKIKQLLEGISQTFRAECKEKKVELILEISNNVPEFIYGDELRLSQILNNLLSNAVKFTPKGYIKISVNGTYLDNDFFRFNCEITDTGIGIQKYKLESIFEDFKQADDRIARQFGGTGLGLSITKKLIALQAGQIKATSTINKGSTFSFYLDYQVIPTDNNVDITDYSIPTIVRNNFENKIVLLVEDNVANLKVAGSYLKHWGLNYDIANNGKEALEKIKLNKYDIFLIDLFMPIMDGFETIKRIRKIKKYAKIPIIALTASAEISLMEKAIETGADHCLTKPFNAQDLKDTISDLLNYTIENIPQEIIEINKNITEFKFINLENIKEASLGADEFVLEMLEILNREIPLMLKDAEIKIHNKEYQLFSKVIHKLKGSLILLGLDSLRNDLIFMEDSSSKGQNLPLIEKNFKELKNIWTHAGKELILAIKHRKEN